MITLLLNLIHIFGSQPIDGLNFQSPCPQLIIENRTMEDPLGQFSKERSKILDTVSVYGRITFPFDTARISLPGSNFKSSCNIDTKAPMTDKASFVIKIHRNNLKGGKVILSLDSCEYPLQIPFGTNVIRIENSFPSIKIIYQ